VTARARSLLLALATLAILAPRADAQAPPAPAHAALESLNPDLASHPYRLDPGLRPYRDRLSVSPAYGWLGADAFYALRVTYNPQSWLGYEASIAHSPGQSVHAVLHTLSAIVRRPLPGRFQPYLAGGYGMMVVFPGQAVNAAPVTRNALVGGGGLEIYVRNDLALRGDLRGATVFGGQRGGDGLVAYQYSQGTIGLSFYRSIRP